MTKFDEFVAKSQLNIQDRINQARQRQAQRLQSVSAFNDALNQYRQTGNDMSNTHTLPEVQQENYSADSGWSGVEMVQDNALALGKGINNLAGTVLYGLDKTAQGWDNIRQGIQYGFDNVDTQNNRNLVSNMLGADTKSTREFYDNLHSDTYKTAQANMQRDLENADGFMGGVGVALKHGTNPVVAVPMLFETLPDLGAGAGIGQAVKKALPKLGAWAGATGEASISSAHMAKSIEEQTGENLTLKQTANVVGSALTTALLSKGLSGKADTENVLVNGTTGMSVKDVPLNIGKETIQEILQGSSQSAFEQNAVNESIDTKQLGYDGMMEGIAGAYMATPTSIAQLGSSALNKDIDPNTKPQEETKQDNKTPKALSEFYAIGVATLNSSESTDEDKASAMEMMDKIKTKLNTNITILQEKLNEETNEDRRNFFTNELNRALDELTKINTIDNPITDEPDTFIDDLVNSVQVTSNTDTPTFDDAEVDLDFPEVIQTNQGTYKLHTLDDIKKSSNGTALGKQLGFKTNVKPDAFAGGTTKADTLGFAKVVDEHGLGGLMKNFSGFADGYHARKSPNSLHNKGVKFDLSLKSDKLEDYIKYKKVIEDLAKQAGYDVVVVAEHKEGASKGLAGFKWYPNTTGNHFDVHVKGRLKSGTVSQSQHTTSTGNTDNKAVKIINPKHDIVSDSKGSITLELADGTQIVRTGTRGWRNNNSGNLEASAWTKKQEGYLGSDGRFAIFDTWENGQKAKFKLLFEGSGYKNLTINEAINRYAPSVENNTKAYINKVMSVIPKDRQGLKMSEFTANERQAIIKAMSEMEGSSKQGEVRVIKQGTGTSVANPQITQLQSEQSNLSQEIQIAMNNDANQAKIDKLQTKLSEVESQLTALQGQETTQATTSLNEEQKNKLMLRYSQATIESEADVIKYTNELTQLVDKGLMSEESAFTIRTLLKSKLAIKANNKEKTYDHILNGRKGNSNADTNLGLNQYDQIFNSLIHSKTPNKAQINSYMGYLQNWNESHKDKAVSFENAYAKYQETGVPTYLAVNNKTNRLEEIDEVTYNNRSKGSRAYKIDGASRNLVESVKAESELIDTRTKFWESNFGTEKTYPSVESVSNVENTESVKTQPNINNSITGNNNKVILPELDNTPVQTVGNANVKRTQKPDDIKDDGLWVDRLHYDGKTYSMSAVKQGSGWFTGAVASPFNVNPNKPNAWSVANEEEHYQKYSELLAHKYATNEDFRNGLESYRGKSMHSKVGDKAFEVKPINDFFEATKEMTDEQKIAYAKEVAKGSIKTAKETVLNKRYKDKHGKEFESNYTDTNANADVNAELNQVNNDAWENGGSPDTWYYEEQAQELNAEVQEAVEPKPETKSNVILPTQAQATNKKKQAPEVSKVAPVSLKDESIELQEGTYDLVDVLGSFGLDNEQSIIASAIARTYPNMKVEVTQAILKSPSKLLEDIVKQSTQEVVGLFQNNLEEILLLGKDELSKEDNKLLALQSSLAYVTTRLNNARSKEGNTANDTIINKLLENDYESLVVVGTSNPKAKELLKSIPVKTSKVKSNLFTVMLNGLKSFLGIPNKTEVTNLYEQLLDTTGGLIEYQSKDSKEVTLSVLAKNSKERKAELEKEIPKQNIIKASFVQSKPTNLVKVKDLSIRLREHGLKELSRIGATKPNKKQQEVLSYYLGFESEMRKHIYAGFRAKDADFKYQDFKQFFNIGTNENPIFDENIITAMSLAIFDTIVATGGDNGVDSKGVAKLLGMDIDDADLIPWNIVKYYKDKNAGDSIHEFTNKIGKKIVSNLGLTMTDDVPAQNLARLEASMGDWAVASMQIANLLYENSFDKKLMAQHYDIINDTNTADDTQSLPITTVIIADVDTVKEIVEVNKETNNYLSNVFGFESAKVYPTLNKPTSTVKKIEKTSAQLTKAQQKIIAKAQEEPMVINQEMNKVVDTLLNQDKEFLLDLIGAKVPSEEELNKIHKSKRVSKEESAKGILRDFDNYIGYRDGLPSVDTEFYDHIKVVVNTRMHYTSNVVNFQSSKLHRALVEYKNFAVEIDVSEMGNKWYDEDGLPLPHTYFLRAVFENAEGTESIFEKALENSGLSRGYTVDKLSSANFAPIAWNYLTTDKAVQKAVKAMQALQQGQELNQEQKDSIAHIVKKWGMQANSLRALMEVANLFTAIEQGTTLKTSLGLGSDGVNNGTGIGMTVMGINDTKTLERVGIFGKDSPHKSYYDGRYDESIKDYYDAFKPFVENGIAEVLAKEQEKENYEKADKIEALQRLNTTLTKRKTLKAILIPFGYGASNARLIISASERMLADIYDTIESIHKETDLVLKARLYNSLQADLDLVFNNQVKLPNYDGLLEFTFNQKQEKYLKDFYKQTIGKGIKSAIKEYAGEFSEVRNLNVKLHEASSNTYLSARKQLMDKVEQERIENIKKNYPEKEHTRMIEYATLSNNEIKELVDEPLAKANPKFATAHADSDDDKSIELIEKEKTFRDDLSMQPRTHRYDFDKDELVNRSTKPLIKDVDYKSAGLRPNSQAIQQLDSYVSSRTIVADGVVSINVHDANIINLLHQHKAIIEQNKAFFEGTATYHIFSQSIDTLLNVLDNLDVTQTDLSEFIKPLVNELPVLKDAVFNSLDNKTILENSLKEIIKVSVQNDLNKIALLKQQGVIHQYAGEGGQYTLTDKDYALLDKQETIINGLLDNFNTKADHIIAKQTGSIDVIDGVHYGNDFLWENYGNLSDDSFDVGFINNVETIINSKKLQEQLAKEFLQNKFKLVDTQSKDQSKAKAIAKWLMDNRSELTGKFANETIRYTQTDKSTLQSQQQSLAKQLIDADTPKSSVKLFNQLVSLNPNLPVHVVDGSTPADKKKFVASKGGAVYDYVNNEVWIDFADKQFYGSNLEKLNHELIHSVTYTAIESGKYDEQFADIKDKLGKAIIDGKVKESDDGVVEHRLMTAWSARHELLPITFAEKQVRDSLPKDIIKELNTLFLTITGDFKNATLSTTTRRPDENVKRNLSGDSGTQQSTQQSRADGANQSSQDNQRDVEYNQTLRIQENSRHGLDMGLGERQTQTGQVSRPYQETDRAVTREQAKAFIDSLNQTDKNTLRETVKSVIGKSSVSGKEVIDYVVSVGLDKALTTAIKVSDEVSHTVPKHNSQDQERLTKLTTIKPSTDLASFIQAINADTTDKVKAELNFTKFLTDALKANNPTLKIEWDTTGLLDTSYGGYSSSNNTIYLNPSYIANTTPENVVRLINHEVLHALTETGIIKGGKAYNDLVKMYEQLKTKANGKYQVQLANFNEFVAYGLTDEEFRNFIADNLDIKALGIKAKQGKFKTALNNFLTAIYSLFGLKKSTNFSTFVDSVDKLIVPFEVATVSQSNQNIRFAQAVNDKTPTEVFMSMDKGSMSDEHNTHLDNIIQSIIGEYYQRNTDPKMVDLSQGKLKNNSLISGLKSSDKEAFVTEALMSVFEYALDNHQGTMAVNGLDKLYRNAQSQFKSAKAFFPEYEQASPDDKARMNAIFNFVFNNKVKQDNVATFMALAIANEQFRETLNHHTIKKSLTNQDNSWFDKVMGVLESVFNMLDTVFFKAKSGNAKHRVDAFVNALSKLEVKARNTQVDYLQTAWEFGLGKVGKHLENPLRTAVFKVLSHDAITQNSNRKVRYFGRAINTLKDINDINNAGKDASIDRLISEMNESFPDSSRFNLVRDTLNELTNFGSRGKWLDAMVRKTQELGQLRQRIKDGTLRTLNQVFTDELSRKQKTAITKVLLKTDMSSLLTNGFDMNKALSMLDAKTRQQTTTEYQAKLKELIPNQERYNDTLHQIKSLGLYMAQEKVARHLVKSSEGIAIGLGFEANADFNTMNQEVYQVVDVLVSLDALSRVSTKHMAVLNELKDTQLDGIKATLLLHKSIVAKAKSEFKDNPYNYQKGYLPEINHPHRKVVWVMSDEVEKYQQQGFNVIANIKQDTLDETDERIMMVHTAYEPNNYVSGALDMVDTHARGTPIYEQGVDNQAIGRVAKENAKSRQQRAKSSNYNPLDDVGAMMVTYDTDGAILNYHYEMSGAVRDELLERNNDFDELLSTENAKLEFKPEMVEHQQQLAKDIAKDAKANAYKHPNEFVWLDFNSSDKDIQRVVKMLPYAFRQELIKEFGGGKTIPIHKSAYTATFGFRAYSIVNMFDTDKAKLYWFERVIVGFFKTLFKEKSRQRALELEQAVQLMMTTIKDWIVIRSGGVLLGNILSNMMLLTLQGVNPIKIIKDSTFAWRNAKNYKTNINKLAELDAQIMATNSTLKKSELQRQRKTIEQSLNRNPLQPYMQAGLMSTIVEDLSMQEDIYKSPLQAKLDKYMDKIPKKLRDVMGTLTLDKGTLGHNFLSEATQFSDFAAKYVLAKYNQEKGMNVQDAIYEAQINFINYDMPTNKFLDYMNRMGFMMFTKFFLRFQQTLIKMAFKAPVLSGLQHGLVEQLGGQGIYEPFIINRFGNPFDGSVFIAPSASGEVLTNALW